MGEGNKRLLRDIEPVPENKQHSKRTREEAGFESPHGEENKHLLRDASGANPELENKQDDELLHFLFGDESEDDFHGEENEGILGFACPECLDFQLDLAKSALEYYEKRKNDTMAFDEVQVLSACFLNSWPRETHSRKTYKKDFREDKSTDKTDKCHISFSAKPKNNGFDDVSPKWFFAELLEADNGDFRPVLCEMMDPSDPGITYGCGYCPSEKKFPHHPRWVDHFNRLHPFKLYCGQKAAGFKHHHRLVKVSGESKRDNIKLKNDKWLSHLEAATTALTYDKMYSMYEVEEVVYLEKMPFSWVEVEGTNEWWHMVFTASPKNTSDAYPKRFFGELKFDEESQNLSPTYCCMMETTDSGLTRGCGFCPPDEQLVHPAGGYKCGAWVDPPFFHVALSPYDDIICNCGGFPRDNTASGFWFK